MNVRLGLLALTLCAAITVACSDEMSTPTNSAEGVEETLTATQPVVANANWQLVWGTGNVVGDNQFIMPYSNSGTSVPSAQKVFLSSTSSAAFPPGGSFNLTNYQPGGTYSTGVSYFTVNPGVGVSYQIAPGSTVTAQVSWKNSTTVEIRIRGQMLESVVPGGESMPLQLGSFEFRSLMSTLNEQPGPPQDPLPFDPSDEILDGETCPAWVVEEKGLGQMKFPNQTQRSTSELHLIGGDEVRSGWDGQHFVVKFEINLDTNGQDFGATLIFDQLLVEGQLGTYRAQVFQATRDNNRRWNTITEGSYVDVDIVEWNQGMFTGEFNGMLVDYVDDSGNGIPYWEYDVPLYMSFSAPLPQYNEAYDAHCEELEEDEEGFSLLAVFTSPRMLAIAASIILYQTDKALCKNSYPGNGPEYWACMEDARIAHAARLVLALALPG